MLYSCRSVCFSFYTHGKWGVKIKKAKDTWSVRRASEGGKTVWYLAERTKRQTDGSLLCTGKIIDITETIEPYINHCNSEVNMLTDMIVHLIDENLKLRGLTVSERDRVTIWQDLKTKFRR